MDLTTVSCNKCGAALQIPPSANFVTCRYCNSQLQITRTSTTISTEILSRIDQHTTEMAEDLAALRRNAELEQLDRDWASRREGLMVTSKSGARSTPTVSGGFLVIFIGGGFGLFWTIMAFSITAHSGAPGIIILFPVFGLILIVGSVIKGLKIISSAQTYVDQEADYLARRNAFLNSSRTPPSSS